MNEIKVNFENLNNKERRQLLDIINKANRTVKLSDIEVGETFKIGDTTYIKFADKNGQTTAVTKDTVFNSEFGESNNFAESKVLERLKREFLPKVTEIVGDENICEFETDLTTLDGVKTYGTIKSKISLPTLNFYREYTEIFDKYKLDGCYWLATSWSALPHYNSSYVLCVSPSGRVDGGNYNYVRGVRPILHFVSSISVSYDN